MTTNASTPTTPTAADLARRASAFRALHVPGSPLVLFNVWDAGSARAVAASGAPALATGSWSVAAAHGYDDGEHLPLELVFANLAQIVRATALPVSVDLESGYGADPSAVADTVARAIACGAVGCNLEDSNPAAGDGSLRGIEEQAARLAAVRRAAAAACAGFFVNARCDVYFQPAAAAASASTLLEDALQRAEAYASAGADGLFVPGLADADSIAALVARSPLPVNIMMSPKTPALAELARIGVARVSHGPGPYRLAMAALEAAARAALPQG